MWRIRATAKIKNMTNLISLWAVFINSPCIYYSAVGRPPEFKNPSNRSSQYTQGSPIRLKCHVNGKLSFNVTWLKNGRRLGKAERKLLKSKGRVLHFQKLSPSQAGLYICIVENEFGRTVKAFDVKVIGELSCPFITPFLFLNLMQ